MAIELDATAVAERRAAVDVTATAAGSSCAHLIPAASLGPGARLAHFRVERPLGHGGMGEVWLATDLALDRPVAVKLLPAAVASDPGRRERLVREARAVARLNHPNICHIYFIGEDAGRVFFAMEHVAGETLAQRLERGPLAPDDAIELARMAAQGLREAHRAGFTHRDVKPSNLMIDGNGILKVMDFGLVAASTDADRDPAAPGGPVAASALVGTPLYMAPEQGRGEAVDLRADIYALGATLHHMIAGAPPFAGDTAADLLSRHQTGARPPLAIVGRARRTTRLIDEVIARMMAKRPEDRFSSYDALIDALDRASTVRTRPAGFWSRGVATFFDLIAVMMLVGPLSMVLGLDDGSLLMSFGTLLYPLMLTRFGTTPGHALLELEIVDHATSRRPTVMAALTRGLVQYGLLALGAGLDAIGHTAEISLLGMIAKACVIGGLAYPAVDLARVSWRSLDKRTLWDRAAGTRVQYRRGGVAPSPARGRA